MNEYWTVAKYAFVVAASATAGVGLVQAVRTSKAAQYLGISKPEPKQVTTQ